MEALIAFIALGVIVATLIEVNERIKAKRKMEDCKQEQPSNEDCSACDLLSVCEKQKPTAS